MEVEYKWDLTDAGGLAALDAAEKLSPYIRGSKDIAMHAIYYDTVDGDVLALRGGLRRREENGLGVCSLKLEVEVSDGKATREEYEVACDDIRQALELLPEAGAPRDVCEMLAGKELKVNCETEFDRRAFSLAVGAQGAADAFEAELAFDEGVLRRDGREREFREMELEHKDGSLDAFNAFALDIQDTAHLTPQPLSKLARAMSV